MRELVKRFFNSIGYLFLASLVFVQGCSTIPSKQFDDSANALGLTKTIFNSGKFDSVIYSNNKDKSQSLHVYIGGDGSPWIRKRYKAKDPTSVNPVILDLIELDTNNAIILGRPCYHQYGRGKNCDAKWWTSHRYSIEIVDAMVKVLEQYLSQKHVNNIILIGFSGGGTLAMLMAEKLEQISHVITINGNLDVDSWTQQHGYTPLYGSLNPIKRKPLAKNIKQFHLFGAEDKNINPSSITQHYQYQPNVQIKIYAENTHTEGWVSIWPDILILLSPGS